MTSIPAQPADPAAPPRGFVTWLSVAQLVGWGVSYYQFALLLEHFERDLSVSRLDAATAFSLALLVEGALAYAVGRLIERGHGRAVMCTGSLLAGLSFAALAAVDTRWQLYVAWVATGIGMACTLYQPAFSILIRRYPHDYRRAIIKLTFLGGLAGTAFVPLGAALIAGLGWRPTVVLLGVVQLAICVPIYALVLRHEPGGRGPRQEAAHAPLGDALRLLPFWGVAVFFVLTALISNAMGAHMVTLLRERGLDAAWAVAVPAVVSLLQVAGRMLLYVTEGRFDARRADRWIPALFPLSLAVLLMAAASPALALVFALLYGIGNGMITIVKATAIASYVSRPRAASLNGLLGIPGAAARALGPFLLAALWSHSGSYELGLQVLVAFGCAALLALWLTQRWTAGADTGKS